MCVDITDIDTTRGREEDGVGKTRGSDADVRLRRLGVGQEGLDDERTERASDRFDLEMECEYVKRQEGCFPITIAIDAPSEIFRPCRGPSVLHPASPC